MIVVRGTDTYGRVERVDDTVVVTSFKHVWFFPVWPQGSFVVDEKSPERSVAIGRHARSIVVAYLQTWGLVWVVMSLIAVANGGRDMFVAGLSPVVVLVMTVVAFASGHTWLRRISTDVARQRRIYATFTGIPVDVARFSRAQREDLWDVLKQALTDAGRSVAAAYRDGPDPVAAWRELARDPRVPRAYLEAALTCARLETGASSGRARAAHRALHAEIWARLR